MDLFNWTTETDSATASHAQLPWLTATLTKAQVWSITAFLAVLLLSSSLNIKAFQFALHYVKSWKYLFKGQKIIQEGYDKSNGQPYEVYAPDNRYVFVSSPKHIKELDTAPDTVLSLQAASKQMLQPVYTMQKFNWFDRRGTEGVGFIRALRTLLTNNLPQILPDLSAIIRSRMMELRESHKTVNGEKQSPVYPMVVKLVVLSNAVSFFGKDLAKDEKFMESALEYIEQTLICAEIVRLLPKFIAPTIGNFIGRRLKAQDVIFNTLLPIAEQRVVERSLKAAGQEVPQHADCIQWILETSPRQNPWSASRVVHELMAIWFGSVHAVSTTITFAIHDLCLHPEYAEPLRKECVQGYAEFERTGTGLPLLDSFIKESARLTPVEAQSTRRSALQPFKLSDGTMVGVGDWACTPVRAIMQSPEFYPSPLEFNGFRFADPSLLEDEKTSFKVLQPKPSKLTDCDNTFHVWGTGRMACPGRFYATAVMKVILGQILLHYDCDMVPQKGHRYMEWRSTILPRQDVLVVFKPLEN
ncbi:cytochrome P450 [Stachybotrys elegans]|uniref:Cytochrome P450 n=1 Tax=Stachybotrys elegans TaxID=80388 RepID=A0A8K0SJ52_9HYPO|nr:cytochrome P450 [Stachybotrys elegans]